MALEPRQLHEIADALLDRARRQDPEGETFDLDEDFDMEELVQLRSHLSTTRKMCDVVNGALARYWEAHFGNLRLHERFGYWKVDHTKQRRVVDDDMLYEWLASLDAEEIAKVVTASRLVSILKVSGMSPAERDTHIVEEYNPRSGLSIQHVDLQTQNPAWQGGSGE